MLRLFLSKLGSPTHIGIATCLFRGTYLHGALQMRPENPPLLAEFRQPGLGLVLPAIPIDADAIMGPFWELINETQ